MLNNNPFSLEGKSILVTGASSGIGRSTAQLCAEMGAKVVVSGRNIDRLNNTLESLQGDCHSSIIMDFSDPASIERQIPFIPQIDGIANCAGIADMNPFPFINQEEIESVFSVNCFSPVMLVKHLLTKKKLQKGSSVVFVSSIDGPRIVHPGNSVYSASKSALVGMARNMAIDLAGKKIRVNCVLPGTTDTPMIRTSNVTEDMLQETARTSCPMKRFASPEDIANAIVFLLSDASAYVTGTELVIDGGYSIL